MPLGLSVERALLPTTRRVRGDERYERRPHERQDRSSVVRGGGTNRRPAGDDARSAS
jgi:hypothetical protein